MLRRLMAVIVMTAACIAPLAASAGISGGRETHAYSLPCFQKETRDVRHPEFGLLRIQAGAMGIHAGVSHRRGWIFVRWELMFSIDTPPIVYTGVLEEIPLTSVYCDGRLGGVAD